jgi:hypothetical protein
MHPSYTQKSAPQIFPNNTMDFVSYLLLKSVFLYYI